MSAINFMMSTFVVRCIWLQPPWLNGPQFVWKHKRVSPESSLSFISWYILPIIMRLPICLSINLYYFDRDLDVEDRDQSVSEFENSCIATRTECFGESAIPSETFRMQLWSCTFYAGNLTKLLQNEYIYLLRHWYQLALLRI